MQSWYVLWTAAQQFAEKMLNGEVPVSGSDPNQHPLEDPDQEPIELQPPQLPPERNRKQPIVLDFGPGANNKEIDALLQHYRGRARVVAIELGDGAELLPFRYAVDIALGDFDVIQGDMSDPSILARHGYGCGAAAFSLWPRVSFPNAVSEAFNNLVCSGGSAYVVSDLRQYEFEPIVEGVKNTYTILYNSAGSNKPITPKCVTNPFDPDCAKYGDFSWGIVGLDSIQNKEEQYVLKAIRK